MVAMVIVVSQRIRTSFQLGNNRLLINEQTGKSNTRAPHITMQLARQQAIVAMRVAYDHSSQIADTTQAVLAVPL